jgi:hypothetical protein
LPLTAKAGTAMGAYDFRVHAKGSLNGKDYIRLANVTDVVKQSLANLAFPPREMLTALSVAVTDKSLFVLTAKTPIPEIVRGTPANVTITATRAMGFADEIALVAVNLPANVTVAVKPIGKGTNDIPIQITAAAAATPGPFTITLRGTTKTGGKDFAYNSAPIPLVIQAEKKKEPEKMEPVKEKPKDKTKEKDKK